LGRGRDLGALERRGAAATAQRLGVAAPGLTLAKTVVAGRTLYQGWEDCSLDVAGPRTGKPAGHANQGVESQPAAAL
jgi:hypothetical protein